MAKFKRADVVVAIESFFAESAGHEPIHRGRRFAGDDPIVRANEGRFITFDPLEPEGALADRIRHAVNELYDAPRTPPAPDPTARRIRAQLTPEESYEVIDGFRLRGDFYPAGRRVRRDDPIIREHPELFQIPARPLPRDLSTIAAGEMAQATTSFRVLDLEGRACSQGQLVEPSDPIVGRFPEHFQLAPRPLRTLLATGLRTLVAAAP